MFNITGSKSDKNIFFAMELARQRRAMYIKHVSSIMRMTLNFNDWSNKVKGAGSRYAATIITASIMFYLLNISFIKDTF